MKTCITFRDEPNGKTRVDLMLDAECVSWLEVIPFTIRVGEAEIGMDGIANVNTIEEHRMKGYSRRVVEATADHMIQGYASVSMLYGIGNLYHKFGYSTVGPDHYFITGLNANDELPEGWSVRAFAVDDLRTVRNLYSRVTCQATGSAVRPDDHETWQQIIKPAEALRGNACRVIIGPDGEVHAYAWLAHWCYAVEECLNEQYPDAFVIGEAIADSPTAADALLAACRQWAREDGDAKNVLLPIPPDTHIATAAMYQEAYFHRDFEPCGGSMVRVLSVKRLLEALSPEIRARLQAAGSTFTGTLTIRTDIGNVTLLIEPDGVRVEDGERSGGLVVEMPQTALGRLALGAFPPEDILARFAESPDEKAAALLRIIFPLRHPHMYLPDRF